MKPNIGPRRWALLGPPLGLMLVLFALSSLPGTPGTPAGRLIGWVPPSAQNMLHVPVYATLAWLWLRCLLDWPVTGRFRAVAPVLAAGLAALYGIFDEFHQLGVPGRFFSLTDIAFNTVGALLGAYTSHILRRAA